MAQTIRATFDGEVLRPEQPVDLEPNTTYRVTIGRERSVTVAPPEDDGEKEHPLTLIGRLAAYMGVTDLAARHDFYAHDPIATAGDHSVRCSGWPPSKRQR